MTRFSTRFALGLLALLSACDSGSGETDALVGSWTPQETAQETYVTVNTAQQVVDTFGPTDGTISFSGAATGSFRYAPSASAESVYLTTSAPGNGRVVGPQYELRLERNGSVLLSGRGPNGPTPTYALPASSRSPFTFANNTITVGSATLRDVSGGLGTVEITPGTLSYRRISLTAGQRARVQAVFQDTRDPLFGRYTEGRDRAVYTFQQDRTFSAEFSTTANRIETTTGTWSATAADLQIRIPLDGTTTTQTLGYSVSEGALRLSVSEGGCQGQDPTCLPNAASQLGLPPGTLTDVSYETTTTFRPTLLTP